MASYYDSDAYKQQQADAFARAAAMRQRPAMPTKPSGFQGSVGPASFGGTSRFPSNTGAYSYSVPRTTGWNQSTSTFKVDELVKKLENQADRARADNLARYNQAMGIYENIEKMYQPGGAFETAAMEQLDKQRKQDLASAAQAGVSSGLSQTTRQQYASQRWTEEVGAPATVQIQAQAQQLLAGAMGQRAQFIERREDEYPDYATIAQLVMQASSF